MEMNKKNNEKKICLLCLFTFELNDCDHIV